MTTLLDEARRGLTATPKMFSPLWFYDTEGSKLFEAITMQPEYYPTETERAILRANADAIVSHVANPARVAELGAGSSSKTRVLLEAILKRQPQVQFTPIDISEEAIRLARDTIETQMPNVSVRGVVGRNRDAMRKLDWRGAQPWLVIFLGSSIGNYEPDFAKKWLMEITKPMRPGDAFVLGIDRKKDRDTLEQAYDDPAGVTAQFNLNLLTRMNRELGADFDVAAFEHRAFYNEKMNRVEMHLRSRIEQTVKVPGIGDVHFDKDETIHTENSYKYTDAMLAELLAAAGLHEQASYMDTKERFSVIVLSHGRAAATCEHSPATIAAPRAAACEACGDAEQLRVCNTCGHIGCPDSHEGHATSHAETTGHHVFREHDPVDGGWTWCNGCGDYLEE